jgi:glutamate synthase (NADPH/NADH) large chain
MTGGTVVVLGETGRNFAAGMSGGVAYVYDPDSTFAGKCNKSMVALDPVLQQAEQERTVDKSLWHTGTTDEALLKGLIESHFQFTGSPRAKALLENWDASRRQFVKVFPTEYKRALGEMAAKKANKEVLAA